MQRFTTESEAKDHMQAIPKQTRPFISFVFVGVTWEQEQFIQSMREEHAREIQAWKDRLQRELQAQDEVVLLAPVVAERAPSQLVTS
jgi:hypothetical protein